MHYISHVVLLSSVVLGWVAGLGRSRMNSLIIMIPFENTKQ